MKWYLEGLNKYSVFSGRARRIEFWMFHLINIIIMRLLVVIDEIIGSPGLIDGPGLIGGPGIIVLIYALAVLSPSIAVSVRRLHDTGRSAWWLLLVLVPFGFFVLLVVFILDSDSGHNQYGAYPKEAKSLSPLDFK